MGPQLWFSHYCLDSDVPYSGDLRNSKRKEQHLRRGGEADGEGGGESASGLEKRFAYSLLEKLLEYVEKASINMKNMKPASRFSRRNRYEGTDRCWWLSCCKEIFDVICVEFLSPSLPRSLSLSLSLCLSVFVSLSPSLLPPSFLSLLTVSHIWYIFQENKFIQSSTISDN